MPAILSVGRAVIFIPRGNALTMGFNASDFGFVPTVAGHYIETPAIPILSSSRCPWTNGSRTLR
jgi:hypothetical protein